MSARTDFQEAIRRYAAEYQNIQTVRLGKLDGVTVVTGTDGVLWARQWNGKEIKVYNRALVPSDFDLRVLVGIYRTQPGKWFILQTMEDYLTPAGGGRIAYHHTQHEFLAPDMVMLDRRQIAQLSCLVYDGSAFSVQIYGGVVPTANGLVEVADQVISLLAYVPDAGALYVMVEVDDTGALSVHEGTVFGSPLIASPSYYPQPDPGKYPIYVVLLYEGQTVLSNDDIKPIMSVGAISKSSGLQISEASADTPADGDKFGFWDIVDLALKSITWANIKATLKTYFDTLYSALGHTHAGQDASIITYTPADPADWTGGVDPGNTDDALDQLASRMVAAEGGIGKYRQFVWVDDGAGSWEFVSSAGQPVLNLESLE